MAEEKVKKRPVGRPRLMSLKDEATAQLIGDSYTARNGRETHYLMKAFVALQCDIGAGTNNQEDFDKFKTAFPSVISGTGPDHFKLKNTLLAELGRWPKEWIPDYARQVEGMHVKEAVAWLRENRVMFKKEEKDKLVSGTNIKSGDED